MGHILQPLELSMPQLMRRDAFGSEKFSYSDSKFNISDQEDKSMNFNYNLLVVIR